MKYLVFTGPPNSGKTTLIGRLARQLSQGEKYTQVEYNKISSEDKYKDAYYLPKEEGNDFYILLEKNSKYILFFSWGDISSAIDKLKKILDHLSKIGMSPFLVIMSSRDASDWLYNHTEKTIGLNENNKIEIPLGRMVRGNRREKAVDWYLSSIMELVDKSILPNLIP